VHEANRRHRRTLLKISESVSWFTPNLWLAFQEAFTPAGKSNEHAASLMQLQLLAQRRNPVRLFDCRLIRGNRKQPNDLPTDGEAVAL
jgi:hypothetical protein